MGEQDSHKTKKYFFDLHNFDEDDKEPEAPPPPSFSQEELDAARQASYEQGRKDGLAEAKASREKQVTDLLAKVTHNFSELFAAEENRDRLYEGETLFLAQAIFARLFPGLNERQGLAEVERVILQVLENHKTTPEILIEVAPDYVESIQAHINTALKAVHGAGLCTVKANEKLKTGDCRLTWNDGGAERHAGHLAGQIAQILDQTLAEKPRLRDNEMKADTDHGDAE